MNNIKCTILCNFILRYSRLIFAIALIFLITGNSIADDELSAVIKNSHLRARAMKERSDAKVLAAHQDSIKALLYIKRLVAEQIMLPPFIKDATGILDMPSLEDALAYLRTHENAVTLFYFQDSGMDYLQRKALKRPDSLQRFFEEFLFDLRNLEDIIICEVTPETWGDVSNVATRACLHYSVEPFVRHMKALKDGRVAPKQLHKKLKKLDLSPVDSTIHILGWRFFLAQLKMRLLEFVRRDDIISARGLLQGTIYKTKQWLLSRTIDEETGVILDNLLEAEQNLYEKLKDNPQQLVDEEVPFSEQFVDIDKINAVAQMLASMAPKNDRYINITEETKALLGIGEIGEVLFEHALSGFGQYLAISCYGYVERKNPNTLHIDIRIDQKDVKIPFEFVPFILVDPETGYRYQQYPTQYPALGGSGHISHRVDFFDLPCKPYKLEFGILSEEPEQLFMFATGVGDHAATITTYTDQAVDEEYHATEVDLSGFMTRFEGALNRPEEINTLAYAVKKELPQATLLNRALSAIAGKTVTAWATADLSVIIDNTFIENLVEYYRLNSDEEGFLLWAIKDIYPRERAGFPTAKPKREPSSDI